MTFLLPVAAALVALVILPGWSFFFDVTPKIVVALAGAALAFSASGRFPAPLPPRLKWFGILAAAQVAAILLATLFSTHRTLSVFGSTWRKDGLFAELAVLILAVKAATQISTGSRVLRIFLRITVLAALPAAIYGIAQYFGIDPWIPSSGYHFGEGRFMIVRPPSTLGHAAYFATYLLFSVFGGVALALSETSRAWKTAALLTSAVAVFAIVLSGTRAALAGLLLGALFVAARQRFHWKQPASGGKRPASGWKWMVVAPAILVLLAGFYVSPAGSALRARVHWSREDPLGGARLLLWRDTLRMSGGRWLAGYGPESFTVEFPRHQTIELARAYPDVYHESPHNIFLDALVSEGVLGLSTLLAIAGFGLMIADGPVGGAFVAILVSQQFSAFTLPTELYFFLSVAILTGSAVARHAGAQRAVAKPVAMSGARPLRGALAALFACFALYLATGDFLLASARRALDEESPDRAARYVAAARRWNASADIYFSGRFLNAKAGPEAMDCATRAPGTADDRQNALVNLAAFYAARDDAPAVESSLREAIAAAPNWFKPHWLLAQVLAREGRAAEAEAEARAAVDRDGGKNPEVSQVMEQLRRR